ncbi:MarR family transcriptional regulator [Paenibacillus timonensis]|uniref:MarR family winged helix-turn-helix transcriptional regulator n=1 Tax=Paenibacillus timonensis TaxID=225915 RepID=A0ABW3S6G0_9BACL|nr:MULTISPECIES: MarR family transcriptional regulator [Paenibacillus]MCH1639129.1 MarR family transcriptional regulator [Paenibacillus timonensis]MDU2241931.1 MarR family transcriptional regulator [Paenibacillus sp.]
MDDKSLETIELEMAVLYRRITTATASRKYGNLDRSAYLLLHRIGAHGAVGVKSLADEFQLDISTVSRQAAALEQKGYVRRIPDPADRRAFFMEITELGAKEYADYKAIRLARIHELLADWPEEERETFAFLLQKFNRALLNSNS